MIEHYSSELRLLLDTKLRLPVKAIHFWPRQVFEQDTSEMLRSAGIDPENKIYYDVLDSGYGPAGLLAGTKDEAFRGVTISVREGENVVHHIFIQSDIPRSTLHRSEDQVLDLCIQQLLALTHELGHVRDMTEGTNFNYEPKPTVWLAKAEAEAHAFSLEYFGKRALVPLRHLLAKKLFQLSTASTLHEKEMYAALCSRVGKGRIKRWAAAE